MTRTWQPHLTLIRRALSHIERYRPADEETFLIQTMIQDAILMRLQEIGENLARMRHIDEDAFAVVAADSWIQLIGLRNVISHGYHQIRPDQIGPIVTQELPAFAATIDAVPDDR